MTFQKSLVNFREPHVCLCLHRTLTAVYLSSCLCYKSSIHSFTLKFLSPSWCADQSWSSCCQTASLQGAGPALAGSGNFHVSDDLQVLASSRKNFKDKLEWEQSKFCSERERERGQDMGTAVKEAKSTHLSGHRPPPEWGVRELS